MFAYEEQETTISPRTAPLPTDAARDRRGCSRLAAQVCEWPAAGVHFGEVGKQPPLTCSRRAASAESACSRRLLGGLRAMSELPPLRGDEGELIRSYTPLLERRLA
jgi:hypothetical protein